MSRMPYSSSSWAACILCWIALPLAAVAQPRADFEADVVAGCSPVVVTFSDSSSGGVTSRTWIFGNGNTSTGNNLVVTATYVTPGFYDVTLVVSDGFQTDSLTKTAYIHVFDLPNPAFTTVGPVTGCAPLGVTFQNNSTATSAPIAGYRWNFGDGSAASTVANPSHVYQFPGTYSVELQVTDTNGCEANLIQNNIIVVDPSPTAAFTADTTSRCQPPLAVSFQNQSFGLQPLQYNWNLGVGTSTQTNPQATYTNAGGYTVSLIVTDPNGCADTLTEPNYIAIGNVIADFTLPTAVCAGEPFSVINTSFGGNTFLWDFGGGNQSTAPDSTTHSFPAPGTYSITLTADAGPGCTDQVVKTITVETVEADFTSSPNYGCQIAHTVNYTDQSSANTVAWEWHFGNPIVFPSGGTAPNTSNLQNPVNQFTEAGYFDDTLIVTSALGCIDTLIKPANVYVFLPNVAFIMTPAEGCAPLTVTFADLTTPFDSIATWTWDYGDGSPLVNQQTPPDHTYTQIGTYMVELTITTTSGCTHSKSAAVRVGSNQQPGFFVDTLINCASDSFQFINTSQDTNLIQFYQWSFGPTLRSSDKDPKIALRDTGYFDVTLVTDYNGCKDTLSIDSMVQALGPVARFDVEGDCDNPYDRVFKGNGLGYTDLWWDFADGSPPDTVNDTTSHTYAIRGNFRTQWALYNSVTGCRDTAAVVVYIRDINACFSVSDTTPCLSDNVQFDANCSRDAIFYSWYFEPGASSTPWGAIEDHRFSSRGFHTPKVVAHDYNGCTDTTGLRLKVYQPVANYTSDTIRACSGDPIQFFDQSIFDTTAQSWLWNFGNGGFSTQQNPSFSYIVTGNDSFNVQLTVTDVLGCQESVRFDPYTFIYKPPSFFTTTDPTVCARTDAQFTGAPLGYTYAWDFGDGGTSTLISPTHAYQSAGQFSVSLTVTDSLGCDSTYTRPSYLQVQDLGNIGLMATPDDTFCYPATIRVEDTSGLGVITQWEWDVGDGTPPITTGAPVLFHTYQQPGNYNIGLVVYSTFGCVDTLTFPDVVSIRGPYARLKVDPDTACFGEPVLFHADSAQNVGNYLFDFGDGNVSSQPGSNPFATHTYQQEGWVTAFLTFEDSLAQCIKADSISFWIDRVEAAFTLSDTAGCEPLVVSTQNTSYGADLFRWLWGTGDTAHSFDTSYTYTNWGGYTPTLVVWSDTSGCRDTATQAVIVHPLPNVGISQDQLLCSGDSVQLLAAGGVQYQWSPTTGLRTPDQANTWAVPTDSITYTVEVTDANGCVNEDSVTLDIQFSPNLTLFPTDTIMFIGQVFPIFVEADGPTNFSWTPSDDLSCSDCPFPVATPEQDQLYTLYYTDLNGCFAQDTSFLLRVDYNYGLFIPNAFTPDGDQLNDVFKIENFGFKKLHQFQIFDRWGNLVFQTADLNEGWDGTYKGRLASPNSVYVYKVIAERFNGEILEQTGKVVLLVR